MPESANPYFVCSLPVSTNKTHDTPVSMNKTDKMLRKMELFASKQDDEEFWDSHEWDNEEMHRQSDKIMRRLLILSQQTKNEEEVSRLNNMIRRLLKAYNKVCNDFWYS